MKILNHKLFNDDGKSIPFKASPNYSTGRTLKPDYLVIHFTAGSSAAGSISWLRNKQAQASAHLVIARDGTVTQLVRFDKVAWHAGRSAWDNKTGLNKYSIGIELDNAGRLQFQDGAWKTWTGKLVPNDQVVKATHKNEASESAWHNYTEAQLQSLLEVAGTLNNKYQFEDIIGHDDIAPTRKTDPGPAFPMSSFKSMIMGRSQEDDITKKTTSVLNIRSGPGTSHSKIDGGPLPKGTQVTILDKVRNWHQVDVAGVVNGENDLQGWVYGKYLA